MHGGKCQVGETQTADTPQSVRDASSMVFSPDMTFQRWGVQSEEIKHSTGMG
jgi:hypothetical protein